jgi:enoyl-CoA hydratase/carnithine racemase
MTGTSPAGATADLDVIDIAAVRAWVAPGRDDTVGAAAGEPLLLVALSDDAERDRRAFGGWTPGSRPIVVVGLRPNATTAAPPADHPCDVVVAYDDPMLLPLIELVRRHPVAAAAAAVLLRHSTLRDVEHGLAAESAVYSVLQAGPEFAAWRLARAPAAIAPDAEPVLIARDGDRLTITLNRPHRHNAVDRALRDELTEAFTLAALDLSIERVVLRGNGPSFCSGGDLDEFGTFPDPATAHASRLTRSPGRLAHGLRDRLTVFLHGACMGAGIEVPAFAGRVLADPDTVIALPELGAGLVPGAGGTVSLPRRIGRHRTALLALSGGRIGARTALEWGLVDEVGPFAVA